MANTREMVLKSLYRIETEGAYSNQELKQLLGENGVPAADRGFATELLLGAVRNKLLLDFVIERFSTVKLKKLSPWIHGILRLGIYQILLMDKVPDSAACNEMVKLAGKYSKGASRGFVNGVLRNVSRKKEEISYPEEPLEFLSVRYSCPVWLAEKLWDQYGEKVCEEILAASLKPYPVTLRVNPLKTTAEDLAKRLETEGVKVRLAEENSCCLYVEGAINVNRSQAYRDGLYTLQNTSSMAAVEVLAPKPGEKILDLCAAPGGKTTFIAEKMENQGKIVACDIHPHKIPLIENAAERLGLSCIQTRTQDATEFAEEWESTFDRVLADVPCSGIGVIHKKPDIKWKRRSEDIPELCEIQRRILENAGNYVKPEGVLVYSTCTILQEENQEQVANFLKAHPEFVLEEERQLLTHLTGGSGFYIAKLRKTK